MGQYGLKMETAARIDNNRLLYEITGARGMI